MSKLTFKMYFESKRSGGCDIKEITMGEDHAIIQFEEAQGNFAHSGNTGLQMSVENSWSIYYLFEQLKMNDFNQ